MMDERKLNPREAVLQRLEAQEIEARRLAQVEFEEIEKQAKAQLFAETDAAESRTVSAMRELSALYSERAQLAKNAIAALGEFCACESAIVARLDGIDANLSKYWQRTVPQVLAPQRWARLRVRAGLNESHSQIGVTTPANTSEQIAATAIRGIVSHNVQAGVIQVGAMRVEFDGGKM